MLGALQHRRAPLPYLTTRKVHHNMDSCHEGSARRSHGMATIIVVTHLTLTACVRRGASHSAGKPRRHIVTAAFDQQVVATASDAASNVASIAENRAAENTLQGRFVIPAHEVANHLAASSMTMQQFLSSLIKPASQLARPPVSGYHVGCVSRKLHDAVHVHMPASMHAVHGMSTPAQQA